MLRGVVVMKTFREVVKQTAIRWGAIIAIEIKAAAAAAATIIQGATVQGATIN